MRKGMDMASQDSGTTGAKLPPCQPESLASAAEAASPKVDLDALSTDAKLILGAHFGLMITPKKGNVTFQTPWNRTARAVAAFEELVSKGVLSVEAGTEGRWAWTYRALVNCGDSFRWFMDNADLGKGFTVMVQPHERKEGPPKGWSPTP